MKFLYFEKFKKNDPRFQTLQLEQHFFVILFESQYSKAENSDVQMYEDFILILFRNLKRNHSSRDTETGIFSCQVSRVLTQLETLISEN